MGKRKICVVTGSRAEYGLLYCLIQELDHDPDLCLQLVVTGMHLSPEFGLTWRQIVADGFTINAQVEMLLSSDTTVAITKSMGLGLIGFADVFQQLQPDIVVVLGDRFEIFVAVQAAINQKIAIAHIHGGELSEGAVDDAYRHAITKLSHLHFTAAEPYRQRVIQLGEHPDRVFNVGAPGLDNIQRLALLDRAELEQSLGFKFGKRNLLITFHPVTLELMETEKQFSELLKALTDSSEFFLIFTHANADAGGRIINQMIDEYRQMVYHRAVSFVSLGSLRYLSLLRQVDAVIGNSSSGLLEAPTFKIPTVNIGDRQRGRLAADSVVHCPPEALAIQQALQTVLSDGFSDSLCQVENPYGCGGASLKIKDILKQVNLTHLLKKQFYDLS